MYRDDIQTRLERVLRENEELKRANELLEQKTNELNARLQNTRKPNKKDSLLDRFRNWSRTRKPLSAEASTLGIVFAFVGTTTSLIAFIAFVASNGHHINGGLITNRYHYRPYTTTETDCTGSGSSRRCTTREIYHPEKWAVQVCDEGFCTEVNLPSSDWENTSVGDFICINEPCGPGPLTYEER